MRAEAKSRNTAPIAPQRIPQRPGSSVDSAFPPSPHSPMRSAYAQPSAHRLTTSDVIALQHTIGNQAVSRRLAGVGVQTGTHSNVIQRFSGDSRSTLHQLVKQVVGKLGNNHLDASEIRNIAYETYHTHEHGINYAGDERDLDEENEYGHDLVGKIRTIIMESIKKPFIFTEKDGFYWAENGASNPFARKNLQNRRISIHADVSAIHNIYEGLINAIVLKRLPVRDIKTPYRDIKLLKTYDNVIVYFLDDDKCSVTNTLNEILQEFEGGIMAGHPATMQPLSRGVAVADDDLASYGLRIATIIGDALFKWRKSKSGDPIKAVEDLFISEGYDIEAIWKRPEKKEKKGFFPFF